MIKLKPTDRSNISPTEWAYLAGLIDGEGNIGVYGRSWKHTGQRQKTPSESYRPVLTITNTKRNLLEWIEERFGGTIESPKVYSDRHNARYIWTIKTIVDIQDICRNCLDYLVLKREQANLILTFPFNVKLNNWDKEGCKRNLELKRGLYHRTLELNKTGTSVPPKLEVCYPMDGNGI